MFELLLFVFVGIAAWMFVQDLLHPPAPPPVWTPTSSPILQRPPGPAVERVGLSARKRATIAFTALHEAAHVVVLHTLWPERGIERVTILSEGENSGTLELAHHEARPHRSPAEDRRAFLALGASCFAGWFAEEAAGRPSKIALWCAKSDLRRALFVAQCLLARGYYPTLRSRLQPPERRLERTVVELHMLASEVVQRRWGAIEALAAALLEHGTLDGAAAIAAFEGKGEEGFGEKLVRDLIRSF